MAKVGWGLKISKNKFDEGHVGSITFFVLIFIELLTLLFLQNLMLLELTRIFV